MTLRTLGLDELHPRDRCYLCGGRVELRKIIAPATQAWAMVCVDLVGCVRRQSRERRLRLFGKASMRILRRAS